jgi:hypothetical protein
VPPSIYVFKVYFERDHVKEYIKIILKEIWWGDVEFLNLVQESGGLLWTRKWTLRFYKMVEFSCISISAYKASRIFCGLLYDRSNRQITWRQIIRMN